MDNTYAELLVKTPLDDIILSKVCDVDPVMAGWLKKENEKQYTTIDLIASENIPGPAVKAIMASLLTTKYAEGYPGDRYYPGNEFVDAIENLTKKRATDAFKLGKKWHSNVQALSGSGANLAVYVAVLKPEKDYSKENKGKEIPKRIALGMNLSSGGHLTHGHPISYTGQDFNFYQYGVTEEGILDYERIRALADEHNPTLIVAGHSAYPRELDYKQLREIADEHDSLLMIDAAHFAGLVVAGVLENPAKYADILTMTTHKTLRGPRGAIILTKGDDLAHEVDRAVFPRLNGGPHLPNIAGIGVCLKEANTPAFKEYGEQIVKNSKKLCCELMDYGYQFTTGGTDNHLSVLDLGDIGITGRDAMLALEKAGILASMSTVPRDKKPKNPSGIRLGTPLVTTRGMTEHDMEVLASYIDTVLIENNKEPIINGVRKNVRELCERYRIN